MGCGWAAPLIAAASSAAIGAAGATLLVHRAHARTHAQNALTATGCSTPPVTDHAKRVTTAHPRGADDRSRQQQRDLGGHHEQ